jgi:hypothetical protein
LPNLITGGLGGCEHPRGGSICSIRSICSIFSPLFSLKKYIPRLTPIYAD